MKDQPNFSARSARHLGAVLALASGMTAAMLPVAQAAPAGTDAGAAATPATTPAGAAAAAAPVKAPAGKAEAGKAEAGKAEAGKAEAGRADAGKGAKSQVQDWTLDPIAREVAKRFESRFDGMHVAAVRLTPYGLYEVQIDTDLIYTDRDVSWVMQGPLIDAKTRENVSAKRLEQLSAIDFADLPKNLAFKHVKGDGSRQIAIFEDPNCGYCKMLRKTLEDVDNITIYTYLFPILSPDSTEKARNVWCAKDQNKVWDDWMLRGKVPPKVQCDAPLQDVLALGKKLMVRGTPAIFFEDGTRSAGALPLEQLLPRL